MQRRSFLTLGAAAPVLGLTAKPQPIAAVEFVRLHGRRETASGVDGQHNLQMNHIYDELRPKPYSDSASPQKRTASLSALYLKIRTVEGLEGVYGPIDNEAALVVERQLKPFLLGKDALAVEKLWDQMYRQNRHARTGHMMMAISAVDNTLWDLRGRFYSTPVYRLLGGPTRPNVEAYGSCLGYSVEPEPAARTAARLKSEGYRSQKWFLAYGPGSGMEGLKKNVELVRVLREAVGDDVQLMFDAFMGWQLDYAIDWAKQVEKYRPRWIEEAFPPDRLEAFAQLRKATSIPVATGEHFYNRWEAHRFLAAEAISVVQADPEWCGGVSELVKICQLATVFDAQVIPHGHSVHAALHVVASQSPSVCPLVEYLIVKMRSYHHFEIDPPEPAGGFFKLTDRPGFGIRFDANRVERLELAKL